MGKAELWGEATSAKLRGSFVLKKFDAGWFVGHVTQKWKAEDGSRLYRVVYTDGDEEDLEADTIVEIKEAYDNPTAKAAKKVVDEHRQSEDARKKLESGKEKHNKKEASVPTDSSRDQSHTVSPNLKKQGTDEGFREAAATPTLKPGNALPSKQTKKKEKGTAKTVETTKPNRDEVAPESQKSRQSDNVGEDESKPDLQPEKKKTADVSRKNQMGTAGGSAKSKVIDESDGHSQNQDKTRQGGGSGLKMHQKSPVPPTQEKRAAGGKETHVFSPRSQDAAETLEGLSGLEVVADGRGPRAHDVETKGKTDQAPTLRASNSWSCSVCNNSKALPMSMSVCRFCFSPRPELESIPQSRREGETTSLLEGDHPARTPGELEVENESPKDEAYEHGRDAVPTKKNSPEKARAETTSKPLHSGKKRALDITPTSPSPKEKARRVSEGEVGDKANNTGGGNGGRSDSSTSHGKELLNSDVQHSKNTSTMKTKASDRKPGPSMEQLVDQLPPIARKSRDTASFSESGSKLPKDGSLSASMRAGATHAAGVGRRGSGRPAISDNHSQYITPAIKKLMEERGVLAANLKQAKLDAANGHQAKGKSVAKEVVVISEDVSPSKGAEKKPAAGDSRGEDAEMIDGSDNMGESAGVGAGDEETKKIELSNGAEETHEDDLHAESMDQPEMTVEEFKRMADGSAASSVSSPSAQEVSPIQTGTDPFVASVEGQEATKKAIRQPVVADAAAAHHKSDSLRGVDDSSPHLSSNGMQPENAGAPADTSKHCETGRVEMLNPSSSGEQSLSARMCGSKDEVIGSENVESNKRSSQDAATNLHPSLNSGDATKSDMKDGNDLSDHVGGDDDDDLDRLVAAVTDVFLDALKDERMMRFRKSMEPEDAQRFKSDFAIVESRMPKCIVIQSAKNLEGIRPIQYSTYKDSIRAEVRDFIRKLADKACSRWPLLG